MRALDFPNNIQIETISYCNASCGFCPYPETSRSEPQGSMDDALFESIVDQISHHPVQLIQPFLNNDPLTDPKILQRTELIIRKNPKTRVAITSNGLRLRPDLARELARLPLDVIHISSHALSAGVYKEIMGIDGWSVLRNVNVLHDEMRRCGSNTRLVITAILLQSNRDEIAHMREYWLARGVEFYLNPLNDRAGNLREDKFLQMLPFEGEKGKSQLLSYDMSGCPTLYSFMGILWNGDLITCCMDWRRARVLGNAREGPLRELWLGSAYNRLRHLSNTGRLAEETLCRGCGHNRFSIDLASLRQLLEKQNGGDSDLVLLSALDTMKKDRNVIQLNLVRP